MPFFKLNDEELKPERKGKGLLRGGIGIILVSILLMLQSSRPDSNLSGATMFAKAINAIFNVLWVFPGKYVTISLLFLFGFILILKGLKIRNQ